MRKYQKQNKSTLFRTVQPNKNCTIETETTFRFTYVDPIDVTNIVGFVKQAHGLMPSIGLHPILRFHCGLKGGLEELALRSVWHRATHSSDYFSIRYMEKADMDAIVDELYPAFFYARFFENKIKPGSFLQYLNNHLTLKYFRKFDKDTEEEKGCSYEMDLRIRYLDLVIIVNIWLFHPLVVMSFDSLRQVIFTNPAESKVRSHNLFSVFLGILNDIKWPDQRISEEAIEWVKQN